MPRHLLRSTGQNVCEETRNAPLQSRAGAGPPPGVPVLPLCALRARPSLTPGSEAPPPLPPSAASTSPARTQPCSASRRLLARHRPGPARPPGVASAGGRPQGAHVSPPPAALPQRPRVACPMPSQPLGQAVPKGQGASGPCGPHVLCCGRRITEQTQPRAALRPPGVAVSQRNVIGKAGSGPGRRSLSRVHTRPRLPRSRWWLSPDPRFQSQLHFK